MTKIQVEADTFSVDVTFLAKSLGIEPSLVQAYMRGRKITSSCERGIGDDAGRYRLTFFYENRRFRCIVDKGGNVIQRSMIDFGDRPRRLAA